MVDRMDTPKRQVKLDSTLTESLNQKQLGILKWNSQNSQ